MTRKELKQLVENLHADAYLWSKQCVGGSSENAQEILQIVYLKILEGKARFNEKSNIKTWLFSIIRYTAIDFLKRHQQTTDIKDIDIAVTDSEEGINYDHLLNQLSEKQRQVILLVFYHNMTLEEVAKAITVSLGSVRQHYARGKKNLKELIIQQQDIDTNQIKCYG